MIDTRRKATLDQVLCIWYLVQLRQKNDKNKNKDISAPIDLSSKVIIMHSTYATKLGLCTRKIDVGTQKSTDLT